MSALYRTWEKKIIVTDAAISRREMLAWAMYDFANSGYTTVVLTVFDNTASR